jgi:uncharacterized protein YjbI with pentapeptide repeats
MRSLPLSITTLAWFGFIATARAANPDQVKKLLTTNQCPSCDLSGAKLKDANLFGANLMNANLQGADLSGANLGFANLSDANLSNANATQAYLYGATLGETNLSGANLQGAYLRQVVLIGNNLVNANLQGANLSYTNLGSLNLKGTNLSSANLTGASFTDFRIPGSDPSVETIRQQAALVVNRSVCLTGNSFSEELSSLKSSGIELLLADLTGTNLSGANLSNAMMTNLKLDEANLSNANLTRATLRCSSLKNAKLDGADLKDTNLEGVVLDGASTQGVKNTDLSSILSGMTSQQINASESEGRVNVGSMNRAQQAYYLEKNEFATKLGDLGLGIPQNTERYQYRIFSYPRRDRAVMVAGIPKRSGLKTYIGLVSLGVGEVSGETYPTTLARLCESEVAKPILPKLPPLVTIPKSDPMPCPAGFKALN